MAEDRIKIYYYFDNLTGNVSYFADRDVAEYDRYLQMKYYNTTKIRTKHGHNPNLSLIYSMEIDRNERHAYNIIEDLCVEVELDDEMEL